MTVKKKQYHKKVVKVIVNVKEPVLLVPTDFPEIEDPIVLLPDPTMIPDDPNWIKKAWKWIIE